MRIVLNKIYPKSDKDVQVEMRDIHEVKRDIEEHIENTIKLIENNRDKTALNLENKEIEQS